jgi:mono/diheme cytochrome c family protein
MIRLILFVSGTALAATLGTAVVSGQAPTRTTNSGVYTAAQAERGKKIFEAKCTTCHDTARFTGDVFLDAWDGKPLKDVWDIASGTMPEDNPGSLPQQEYGDIIAFFLSLNQFPTGETELKGEAAAMATIKIEKKTGASAGGMKSVKAGVYTAAQADRGGALFKSKCASCHAPNRFTDDQMFLTPYAGKPLWDMFEVISESMPEDDPGGMKPEEYADVIAHLLKLNGFPTGQAELPPSKDALSAIVFEKP